MWQLVAPLTHIYTLAIVTGKHSVVRYVGNILICNIHIKEIAKENKFYVIFMCVFLRIFVVISCLKTALVDFFDKYQF